METHSIPIDIVLISHNHYDHLDFHAVKEIAKRAITPAPTDETHPSRRQKGVTFIVALGLKAWFHHNVPASQKGGNEVVELDWHQSCTIDGVDGGKRTELTVTGLPMQHWSNRYGWDMDKTLWCGYAVTTRTKVTNAGGAGAGAGAGGGGHELKFMFSGDTGYFDGVAGIGETYGPFDLAAIPSESHPTV